MNRTKKALEKCRTYVAVQKFGCGHTGIGHGVEDNLLQLLNEAFEELAWLEKREPTLMSDCISAGLPLDVALKYDVQLCRLTNYVRDKTLADCVKQEPVAVVKRQVGNSLVVHITGNVSAGDLLYTRPVRTKDLTDDEIEDAYMSDAHKNTPKSFARAVIVADREKNK